MSLSSAKDVEKANLLWVCSKDFSSSDSRSDTKR